MHKFNPPDNKYILAAWLWIRHVLFIESLAPGQSLKVRATCSLQLLRWKKKKSQSRILLSIYSPGSPCIWSGTDYFPVFFGNKNRFFNFDVRLQLMLVSRTNIRGLYGAICSLQSRAVVHNQFKSSSTLTFSGTQYAKPLNKRQSWWPWSLTPDLSSKCSHGEVIHARTQCHSFSHIAGHKTPSPQCGIGIYFSYIPGNKQIPLF